VPHQSSVPVSGRAPGRAVTTAETARRLLSSAPGEALCDACLAFACGSSLIEMRAVTMASTADAGGG
jgi:hypothetical protein